MLIFIVVIFTWRFPLTLSETPGDIRPVLLWHGLDDTCCDERSLGRIKKLIEREVPGVYVLSVMIGKDFKEDARNSKYMNVYDQVSYVCRLIKNHPMFGNGYNAVGFSQGSQFLRAVAQKCPFPRMFNLISLGGQHQGIFGVGDCRFCKALRSLLQKARMPRWTMLKRKIVPLQYWHDPTSKDEKKYREGNNFIADINNERDYKEFYRQNLLRLQNLVLVKFEKDSAVVPVDSQWFEFYKPGQAKDILPLEQSRLWIEDRIGLRKLQETGRLHFVPLEDADHLQFSNQWFIDEIIKKYLI